MKKKPLISILIINYNNGKLLSRAINSCLIQKYKNLEILVLDDKSTDNSVKVLNSFKKNKKIKIFYNKNKKKNIAALDAMNGYLKLFQKSKGLFVCLLDSDDYFHRSKVHEIYKIFSIKKEIDFVQNLPFIKNSLKTEKKNNKNNQFSFWPYLAPESCISFRKKFMIKFLKVNYKFLNNFKDVWLGFRMGVFAFFCLKKFYTLNMNLTFYESLGQSKKYRKLNKNWIIRRKNSFEYLRSISNNKIEFNKNLDFLITNFLTKLLRK